MHIGAWIITGGTNNGVMALVGEAVNDYNLEAGAEDANIICIGFATWGVIKNNDALTSKVSGIAKTVIILILWMHGLLSHSNTCIIFKNKTIKCRPSYSIIYVFFRGR